MDQRAIEGKAAEFLDEVSAWLILTDDPRVTITPTGGTITDLAGACADFCGYMAECSKAGFTDWRTYFMTRNAPEN